MSYVRAREPQSCEQPTTVYLKRTQLQVRNLSQDA